MPLIKLLMRVVSSASRVLPTPTVVTIVLPNCWRAAFGVITVGVRLLLTKVDREPFCNTDTAEEA